MHQNFDLRTNIAIATQSSNLRMLNAQLISRLGFVSNEIVARRQEVLEMITARGEDIGDLEAICILESIEYLSNAADYASESINILMSEVMFYINDVELHYFYPLMRILQWESNIIQWSVKAEMHRFNPVTQTDLLTQRLEDDYLVVVALYTASISNIEFEVQSFDRRMNEVKQTMFPQLNGIRDYFGFTANFVQNNLAGCNA